jgi:hypothetical protein
MAACPMRRPYVSSLSPLHGRERNRLRLWPSDSKLHPAESDAVR